MAYTGKIIGLSKDYATGKYNLSLSVNEDVRGLFEKYKECEKLSIDIKKYRNSRSIDANRYMWLLLGKIAEKLNQDLDVNKYTKDDIYLMMLKDYGQYTVAGMVEAAVDRFKKEWKLVEEVDRKQTNNKTLVTLICYIGSSNYDTKEMSILIDGVVSKCKELDIETATPDEIEHMKALWGERYEKQKIKNL